MSNYVYLFKVKLADNDFKTFGKDYGKRKKTIVQKEVLDNQKFADLGTGKWAYSLRMGI